MKKCNVCGKNISEFAAKCPYCESAQSAGSLDAESMDKKEHYSKLNTKKYVLISLILSIVLVVFFGFVFRLPWFTAATFIELIIEIACSAYAAFVIAKYNVVSLSRNKLLIICAAIGGIAFSILQGILTLRLYGMGSFAIVGIPMIFKIAGVLTYVARGLLLFFAILDADYLISSRKK